MMLLFDVRGRDCKGIWSLHPLSSGKIADSEVGRFGFALKQTACFNTSEDFEAHLEVLCRLDGKTMSEATTQGASFAILFKSNMPIDRPRICLICDSCFTVIPGSAHRS